MGPKVTWKWKWEGNDYIHARLDNGIDSISFSHFFPSCCVHNTSTGPSDHLTFLIHLDYAYDICHIVISFMFYFSSFLRCFEYIR